VVDGDDEHAGDGGGEPLAPAAWPPAVGGDRGVREDDRPATVYRSAANDSAGTACSPISMATNEVPQTAASSRNIAVVGDGANEGRR